MGIVAVVPIFVTAGAAVLPAVAAAVASVAAVLLRPRELANLVRRRPLVVGVATGGIAVVLAIATWLLVAGLPGGAAKRGGARPINRCDWAKVAEDIIAQERAGRTPTALADESLLDTPRQLASLPAAQILDQIGRQDARPPVKLGVLWSFRPEETMFLSVPALAAGRILAAGCQADLGGYTGLLACLDADTGIPVWQITHAGGEVLRAFFSSPALTPDGKYIVIGQGLHEDRDCSLLCFEATTGRLHWAVKTPLHIESSPAICGDMAVVGAGAIEGPDGKPAGDPGFVLAVRISDGKELWRQAVNDPECSPATDDKGTIFIGSGFNGNAVVAMRGGTAEELREKGRERIIWRTPVGVPVTGAITLAGDRVIAGAGNGDMVHSGKNARGLVIALDRENGRLVWQRPIEDAVLGRIVCRDGMLICPVRTGEVVALALEDGQVLWRTRISGSAPVLAGCAFVGERVYAVSSDGYLAVLDAKNGNVLEKTYLNDEAKPGAGLTMCSPQIVGGRVIVGSETGGLRCLVGSGGAK